MSIRQLWEWLSNKVTDKTHYWDSIYVRQQNNWDCGVACCAMVLNWTTRKSAEAPISTVDYDKMLTDWSSFGVRPCWTIELFFLLHNELIEVEMCSSFMGVNPAHTEIEWYKQQDSMLEEAEEVSKLFAKARSSYLRVSERSLSTAELRSLLVDGGEDTCYIVLIDNWTLRGIRRYFRLLSFIFSIAYLSHLFLLQYLSIYLSTACTGELIYTFFLFCC